MEIESSVTRANCDRLIKPPLFCNGTFFDSIDVRSRFVNMAFRALLHEEVTCGRTIFGDLEGHGSSLKRDTRRPGNIFLKSVTGATAECDVTPSRWKIIFPRFISRPRIRDYINVFSTRMCRREFTVAVTPFSRRKQKKHNPITLKAWL